MGDPVIHPLCVLLHKFEKLGNSPPKNSPRYFTVEGGPNSGPREITEAWANRNQRNLHVKKPLNYLHSLGGLISTIALQKDWHCSMLGQQESESSLALTQLSSEPEGCDV